MRVRQHVLAFFGLFLFALGMLGPLTFADDWRHIGEIAVAVGFALAGAFLLAPKLLNHSRCGTSFPLASPFVLLGLATGTFMDKTTAGVLLGLGAGLATVWWHCSRYRRVAA
jgi:hypothetical protein